MKTGKFSCVNCQKKNFVKDSIKNVQKIQCKRCGTLNLVFRDNGKIKVALLKVV